MGEAQEVASQLLEALGTAWTIHGLYPDPQSQPAFHRSLQELGQPALPVLLEVRPGAFAVEGSVLDVDREGVERLSRRLFLHGVETLKLVAPPREDEVVRFFEVLNRDDEEVQAGGGVEAAMLRVGIDSLMVSERPALVEPGQEEAVERHEEVLRVLEEGADPQGFAARLLEESGEDAGALAELFVSRYGEVYRRVSTDDVSGREETVQAFVEAFFYLPEGFQVAVLDRFLRDQDDRTHQVFLDQFAGHDLARLAPQLDQQGFSLLLDYARLSADEADPRPEELLGMLEWVGDIQGARRAVAASMQGRIPPTGAPGAFEEGMSASGGSFASIRPQLPDQRRLPYDALMVLRGLLQVEERPGRFDRLLRIWTGKIAAALRRGEYRRAELWQRAVLERPAYPAERAPQVEQALAGLATPEIFDMLLREMVEGREGEAQARLVRELGSRGLEALVELLGAENDAGRRRFLVDALVVAAGENPGALLPHLSDRRWYLVRNLVTVLGRVGSATARPALAALLHHDDYRVRVEALRALAPMGPMGSSLEQLHDALGDPHERVRQTAIGLLGAQMGQIDEMEEKGHDRALAALVDALGRPELDAREKRRIVGMLGGASSSQGKEVLSRLAGQRFALSASKRLLREAAQEALQGTSS
ncbi:MAG: HEAT repeat domain-containing protein [Actinomycetota bacterium]|nr:HEAT repeat domain-containing protein [Actinomycetota bacterium]